MRIDWMEFQAYPEDRLLGNPEVNDKCVAVIAAYAMKRRPRADPRLPLPPGIHDGIRAEEAVTSHNGSRSESPGQRPPEVGNLTAERVKEQTVEQCAAILRQ